MMKRAILISIVLLSQVIFAQPPGRLTPAQADSQCASFWHGYDFQDLTPLQSPKVILDYIYLLSHLDKDRAAVHLNGLLSQASGNKEVLRQFIFLFERYLYDLRSRFADEALYETVARFAVETPVLDSLDKSLPQFQLEMISLNRPGTIVNDLVIGFADGSESRLHEVEGEFILLVLSNPECKSCRSLMEKIEGSRLLTDLHAGGHLTKLTLYPGNDLSVWNPSKYPSGWVAAYDKEDRIWSERLFSLRTMPSVYLLDSSGRVLLKEAGFEDIIDYFSNPAAAKSDCFH